MKLEVLGATKFEVPLRAVHETHGVLLKAPDGTTLMMPVSANTLRQFKLGMQAELEQHHRGLSLTTGHSRGWSR